VDLVPVFWRVSPGLVVVCSVPLLAEITKGARVVVFPDEAKVYERQGHAMVDPPAGGAYAGQCCPLHARRILPEALATPFTDCHDATHWGHWIGDK